MPPARNRPERRLEPVEDFWDVGEGSAKFPEIANTKRGDWRRSIHPLILHEKFVQGKGLSFQRRFLRLGGCRTYELDGQGLGVRLAILPTHRDPIG